MKRFCLAVSLWLVSCFVLAETIRLSEPVAQDEVSETFGQPLDASLPEAKLGALLSGDKVGERFQLTTRISKVCQKKGCFFIAQQGEHVVRVSFRDYGFFIPTDSSGKTVTLSGELVSKEVTKQQADHFNKDMGEAGVVKTGLVYEIVADSVKIPRA